MSEYPFFNSFYKLCHQIKILFNLPNNDIPVEIMLYNIIKFTESPINGNVLLSIKPFLLQLNTSLTNNLGTLNAIIEENNEDGEGKDDENKKESNDGKPLFKNLFKKATQIISHDKQFDLVKGDNYKLSKTKSDKSIPRKKTKKKMNYSQK